MQHNLNGVRSTFLMHNLRKVNLQVDDLKQKRRLQSIIIGFTLLGSVITGLFLLVVYKKNCRVTQISLMLYVTKCVLLKAEDDMH